MGLSLIQLFNKEMVTKGIVARSKQSRDWIRNKAYSLGGNMRSQVMASRGNTLTNKPSMGSMYFFWYDPKWKKVLPYYDRFPLMIPFAPAKEGFLGINLHYIAPMKRAQLLDELIKIGSNKSFNDRMRLEVSYKVLKNFAQAHLALPCIKHYLWKHVRSRFARVDPIEWDFAIFLPFEDFAKRPKHYVWGQSAGKAGHRRRVSV